MIKVEKKLAFAGNDKKTFAAVTVSPLGCTVIRYDYFGRMLSQEEYGTENEALAALQNFHEVPIHDINSGRYKNMIDSAIKATET